MKSVQFDAVAWQDYLRWQQADKAVVKRIHSLIQDIARSPFDGIGKPEPLKHSVAGWWSRRISDEHRLVYRVTENAIQILQVRYHYTH